VILFLNKISLPHLYKSGENNPIWGVNKFQAFWNFTSSLFMNYFIKKEEFLECGIETYII
jgi:hypothetical protein